MNKIAITFVNIILAALLSGTMFGIWLGFSPYGLSQSTYVEQQQSMIDQLNVRMPLLGLITILVTLISAFVQKENKQTFISLLIAAGLMIVAGLITRFGNQPINVVVAAWSIDSPPGDWMDHRDRWWSLHILRTVIVLLAFSLLTWSGIKKSF